MATLSTVLNFSRTQALTDSNGLTDADGIVFANEGLLDFRRQLQSNGVDAAQLQESYDNIVGGVGTYLYPTDLFWLKAIELNYSTSILQDYVTAKQIDVSNLPGNSSFSWVRTNASMDKPYFNDMGDWFEIFPTPTSTNGGGIRIWYFLEASEYGSVSDTIAYPESLDYHILGWRICANFYRSLNKFDEALEFDSHYQKGIDRIIASVGQGTQQPLQATTIQETGWNF